MRFCSLSETDTRNGVYILTAMLHGAFFGLFLSAVFITGAQSFHLTEEKDKPTVRGFFHGFWYRARVMVPLSVIGNALLSFFR